MTEEFLQYIWKFRLYKPGICLFSGEAVEIIHPGEQNFDAGPDFFNTRIRIGDTIWAGNTEIHIRASDWLRHNHQEDKNYNNVILHVVLENDISVTKANGQTIPVIELKENFDLRMYDRYRGFMQNKQWVACAGLISNVPRFETDAWLESLLVERLERKEGIISGLLRQNLNDWNETFYHALARGFGFKLNTEAFEMLAKSLPFKYLAKHIDNLLQLEALLFGQAGLLGEELTDPYAQSLWHEYSFLKRKFGLKPIDGHLWRFMRLRPANFPTVRIAQFAMLIRKSTGLMSLMLEAESTDQILSLLDVDCSAYWQTHYQFGKSSACRNKMLGHNAAISLIINTVIPFMFAFARYNDNQYAKDDAFALLHKLGSEVNAITKKWAALGMPNETAAQSQALLELKNNYCDLKKCLNCRIGNTLIRNA
jgi:hypothetical protein